MTSAAPARLWPTCRALLSSRHQGSRGLVPAHLLRSLVPGQLFMHKGRTQHALESCSNIAAATTAADTQEPVFAGASLPTDDERYMQLALQQAQLAFDAGEVPVGAVIVSASGEVLSAAYNQTEGSSDPTAHAELLCIQRAATALGGWRLLDATLYVTLEPCPMCAGALLQSRVGTVVYGARNTLLGADGSWIAMLPSSSNDNSSCCSSSISSSGSSSGSKSEEDATQQPPKALPVAQPTRPHPFHRNMQVRRGVLAEECGSMMRRFFANRRRQQAEAALAAAEPVAGS